MNAARRNWTLAVLMGLTAVAAQTFKPRVSDEAMARAQVPLEQLFPASFGAWRLEPVASGMVRPAFDVARRFQMYDQVLERIYVDEAGHRIMLSAAYGRLQSVGLQMHRPEVCYRAGGFVVGDVRDGEVVLPGGRRLPVTRLVAQMPGRHEAVTHWQLLGQEVAGDATSFRLQQLRLGLQKALPDGMLVRVSTMDVDAQQGWAVQQAFIQDLSAALNGAARARGLGGPI